MIRYHKYSDLSRRAYTGVRVPSGNKESGNLIRK
nr:MAG TPA: hypothetical protein [Caudoviricetes sp.]